MKGLRFFLVFLVKVIFGIIVSCVYELIFFFDIFSEILVEVFSEVLVEVGGNLINE